mmetsp:Transcript_10549/g.25466  ORF Transcript_10549/g.25466 Transcript_10549/m.25466 type:complete len:252 (+) Transcript_10549:1110-1865(+)
MFFCGQGTGQDVVKIKLGNLTVPVGTVVELDACPESKFVVIASNGIGINFPGNGKGRNDLAPGTVANQAFVDPVVGEKLVRTIDVSIHGTNSLEETSTSTWCNSRCGGSRGNTESVNRVVELLETSFVSHQTVVEQSGDSLSIKRHHDCLLVVVLVDIFPLGAENAWIFISENISDHVQEFITRGRGGKVLHGREYSFSSIAINPSRSIRMRIVGCSPGFRNGKVEVSTLSSNIDISLGESSLFHFETKFG